MSRLLNKTPDLVTSREVPEWVGKTPDSKIPDRVKLRVFERYGGVCQETGRKITPADKWDCDHEIALANGGENRERNLRPVLREAHRAKTRKDVAIKKKTASVRKKHLGLSGPKRKIPGSKGTPFKKKVGGGVERRDD